MEVSPLTRQPQPEVFQPKIVQLYETLFPSIGRTADPQGQLNDTNSADDDDGDDPPPKSDGFWTEFFLLRADRPALRRVVDLAGPGGDAFVAHHGARSRELLARSVAAMRGGSAAGGVGGGGVGRHAAASTAQHALESLETFLAAALAKRYAHASSDVIELLAGIDRVDAVLGDLVAVAEGVIRAGADDETRRQAVAVLLALAAGAYQTSLLTYLIQRDLFPAIIKFIQESSSLSGHVLPAFTLLGLLANYNKFEFRNPYQMRLADFINEPVISRIVGCVGATCRDLRAGYLVVQDDLPEGWSLSSALGLLGLDRRRSSGAGAGAGRDDDVAKPMFARLPGPEAAVLLATYDFAHTNKLFCSALATCPAEATAAPSTAAGSTAESPFASFVSLTSYLLLHAPLSARTAAYATLCLTTVRLVVEDPALCRRLCAPEPRAALTVRLCRQRPPRLPLARTARPPAAAILDAAVIGIDHNLRRRLDVGLHTLCVGIMLRIVSHLCRARTRLAYHWAELFRCLLSLLRFLATYVADLRAAAGIGPLLDLAVNVLALALSSGESFLPSAAEYDDLFYKVVEAGETLTRVRTEYGLADRPTNSIDTLVGVSSHYRGKLGASGPGIAAGAGTENGAAKPAAPAAVAATAATAAPAGGLLTSGRVAEVIREGYDSLSIQARDGLDSWARFREADERALVKRAGRIAVEDVRMLGREC